MSRRVKLIFNPHAHRGRVWEVATSLQAIVSRFGEAEWASTEHPMHADSEILAGSQPNVTGLHARVLPGALQMTV